MTFVSYAQNFEDVMLRRALRGVDQGFYIDVGANDPVVDSVTLAFYERGWRGVNVEPTRQYHERLAMARERDTNLRVAAGERDGSLTLFEVPDTGLSTLDAAIAAKHRDAGHPVIEQEVPVTTLTAICAVHAKGPIHFLKIDVEGAEAPVLRGMDFTRWRPWIVVVEATQPQQDVLAHEEWEGILHGARYRDAYFDGLNRFYVADEHEELLPAFGAPPNCFDEFRLRKGHFYSWPVDDVAPPACPPEPSEIEALQAQLRDAHAGLLEACEAAIRASDAAHSTEQAMRALDASYVHSLSWRVTKPLRWANAKRMSVANAAHATLSRHPRVHAAVRSLARTLRLVPRREPAQAAPPAASAAPVAPPAVPMTEPAQRVHELLAQVRTRSGKGS